VDDTLISDGVLILSGEALRLPGDTRKPEEVVIQMAQQHPKIKVLRSFPAQLTEAGEL
jgi:hypothetical protein